MSDTTTVTLSFRDDLKHIINCHSQENGSNTPDFILAKYMEMCLKAFDEATNTRDKWYGFNQKIPIDPQPDFTPEPPSIP